MGKIISDKLFIWDFLAVKLNFNLFDLHYLFPALNSTLQSYWKVHIKDFVKVLLYNLSQLDTKPWRYRPW